MSSDETIEFRIKFYLSHAYFCREQNLLKRIFQCCLLNGGFFGFSIILFEYALLPLIRGFLDWMFGHNPVFGNAVGNWIVTMLSIVFGAIWIMPLFILSKVVNSLWFQVKIATHVMLSRDYSVNDFQFSGYCRFSI